MGSWLLQEREPLSLPSSSCDLVYLQHCSSVGHTQLSLNDASNIAFWPPNLSHSLLHLHIVVSKYFVVEIRFSRSTSRIFLSCNFNLPIWGYIRKTQFGATNVNSVAPRLALPSSSEAGVGQYFVFDFLPSFFYPKDKTILLSSSCISLGSNILKEIMAGEHSEIRTESPRSQEIDSDISKTGFLDRETVLSDRHNEVQIVEDQEENNLSRSLGQRHIQMIALAGAIVGIPFEPRDRS